MRRAITIVFALVLVVMVSLPVVGQGSRTRFQWLIAQTLTVTDDASILGDTEMAGSVAIVGDTDLGDTAIDGWLNLAAQTTEVVGAGAVIVPTGTYQPLSAAAAVTTDTTTPITAGTTAGDMLILGNVGTVTNTITIDGTGGNVDCKANVVLTAPDTLTLIWSGTAWICLSNYDNS